MTVLYHGSATLLDVLEPSDGAIYASNELASAIPFALPIRPDARGASFWSLQRGEGEPRITIRDGWLDTNAVGYVYELAPEGFSQIDPWQWVRTTPVRPRAVRVIRAADYAHWIQ